VTGLAVKDISISENDFGGCKGIVYLVDL